MYAIKLELKLNNKEKTLMVPVCRIRQVCV